MDRAIYDRIVSLISEKSGVPADKIEYDTDLIGMLGMSELAVMNTVLALEAEFGAAIADEDIDQLRCPADIEKYIKNQINIIDKDKCI